MSVGEVAPEPLQAHEHAFLEIDKKEDVDDSPEQPRNPALEAPTSERIDGGVPADDGGVPSIVEAEGPWRSIFPQLPTEVASLLLSHLRQRGEYLAVLFEVRQIAQHVDPVETRD